MNSTKILKGYCMDQALTIECKMIFPFFFDLKRIWPQTLNAFFSKLFFWAGVHDCGQTTQPIGLKLYIHVYRIHSFGMNLYQNFSSILNNIFKHLTLQENAKIWKKNSKVHHFFIFQYFLLIVVHAIARHVLYNNLLHFFSFRCAKLKKSWTPEKKRALFRQTCYGRILF